MRFDRPPTEDNTGALLFSWGTAALDIVGTENQRDAVEALRILVRRLQPTIHPALWPDIFDVIEDDRRVVSLLQDCAEMLDSEAEALRLSLN